MNNENNYHFFWQSGNPLSNHFMTDFYVDGIKYNCVEQYMMKMKALLFADISIADRIMRCTNPIQQKTLGRLVSGYNDITWQAASYSIVATACMAKFGSAEWLKNTLLSTGDKSLVEASPYDRIWGIGYGEENAMNHIDEWGENRLGRILMDVRKAMK